jgi:hypothetical protein
MSWLELPSVGRYRSVRYSKTAKDNGKFIENGSASGRVQYDS